MLRPSFGSAVCVAGASAVAACLLLRRRRRRHSDDDVEVLLARLATALEKQESRGEKLSASALAVLETASTKINAAAKIDAIEAASSAVPRLGLCQTVVDSIGWTPLVRIDPHKLGFPECKAEVFLKLEFQNPGGSVKDRIAVAMIDAAEAAGQIKPGKSTLIEATSGNTGIGLAMVAAARGYRLIVTMPRLLANTERYVIMRAFGAEVALSDPKLKTQGFLDLAEEIARKTPDSYLLRQFKNSANPEIHESTTGPEIWAQCAGEIDALVSGVGTGGTVVGVGQFLKERNPSCRVVAVEPASSRVLQGHSHRVHALTGIGTGLQVPMIEKLAPGQPFAEGKGRGLIDEFMCAEDGDSLDMSLEVARRQGLLVGPSSGAAIIAACRLGCRPEMSGKRIVAICPSSGVRYMQHPMFKSIRDEANANLCAGDAKKTAHLSAADTPPEYSFPKKVALSQETFDRIENAILQLVRGILKSPKLKVHEPMIDHGATSLTAMLILGKVRNTVLEEVKAAGAVLTEAEMSSLSALRGMKVAIIKETLWGSVHELTQSLLGVDDDLAEFPQNNELKRKIVVTYCGG